MPLILVDIHLYRARLFLRAPLAIPRTTSPRPAA